ncbi:MAG: hypothetical protein AAFY72_01500 [Cyanobacteria bacterium J06649_4]
MLKYLKLSPQVSRFSAISSLLTNCRIAAAIAPLAVLSVVPAILLGGGSAAAQEVPAGMNTVCRYDPESGKPNPLGMRSYVTVTEYDEYTEFTLERFPAFVSNSENVDQRADVSEMRSLNLYELSLAEARQLMIDQPYYYAALLDVDVSVVEDEGFAAIDETLGCGQVVADAETPEPETPEPEAPEPETPDPEILDPEAPDSEVPSPETPAPETPETEESGPTLSDLPNGNYRVVSADFPPRIVSDEELLEAGGAVFLFRKLGEEVTGSYGFIDHEGGSCLTGTLEGNTVTGDSFAYGDSVREGSFLTLGEPVGEGRYEDSVLNLETFSRINAGTRLPVESCP